MNIIRFYLVFLVGIGYFCLNSFSVLASRSDRKSDHKYIQSTLYPDFSHKMLLNTSTTFVEEVFTIVIWQTIFPISCSRLEDIYTERCH